MRKVRQALWHEVIKNNEANSAFSLSISNRFITKAIHMQPIIHKLNTNKQSGLTEAAEAIRSVDVPRIINIIMSARDNLHHFNINLIL